MKTGQKKLRLEEQPLKLREDDEESSGFESERLEEEAENTKDGQLSGSSQGSVAADEEPPPNRKLNPFVKAISVQRKDFKYVTQLRKEVINVVEPFRASVLEFDDRLAFLESYVVKQAEKCKERDDYIKL